MHLQYPKDSTTRRTYKTLCERGDTLYEDTVTDTPEIYYVSGGDVQGKKYVEDAGTKMRMRGENGSRILDTPRLPGVPSTRYILDTFLPPSPGYSIDARSLQTSSSSRGIPPFIGAPGRIIGFLHPAGHVFATVAASELINKEGEGNVVPWRCVRIL